MVGEVLSLLALIWSYLCWFSIVILSVSWQIVNFVGPKFIFFYVIFLVLLLKFFLKHKKEK